MDIEPIDGYAAHMLGTQGMQIPFPQPPPIDPKWFGLDENLEPLPETLEHWRKYPMYPPPDEATYLRRRRLAANSLDFPYWTLPLLLSPLFSALATIILKLIFE